MPFSVVVYVVDEKWLHFSTRAVWWAQIIKVVFGLFAVLAVKGTVSQDFMTIYAVIISFYFGTQHEKSGEAV